MSPCSPTDVSFPTPTTPSGPTIPIVGIPFSLKLPNISPFPTGFPEDLLDILNSLQLLIPPGALKPALNPNFGKDIFDGIMKLMDQFFPFLMLYKFFLPILNLIICIIEVLCALMNPFALISAINKLFTQCIPEFLNLFPIFALVIMIISLLLLLLQLIEYIIAQILKLVNDILRNVNALIKCFQDADANGVLAVATKLGALLCTFQNLFVLLSVFNVIIEIIKDMLRLAFPIPPCESASDSGCCSTRTCPAIVQSQYTNTTGTFQYLSEVGIGIQNGAFQVPGSAVILRSESWQLFDVDQTIAQTFSNIYNAYDIPASVSPKPVFFPTDGNYTAATNPNQAPYTLDLRLFYNPASWGRPGEARFIRFNSCIMLKVPTPDLVIYNNTNMVENNGVVLLGGGLGFEDNGVTPLFGFASDGATQIDNQATLNNFIHKPEEIFFNPTSPVILPNDGYTFSEVTYTFKPNMEVLLNKQLVTLGCEPAVSLNRAFVNNVLFSNIGLQTTNLNDLVNGANFPDPNGALQCLSTALSGLRSNLSVDGVAQFQSTALTCLSGLQANTNSALGSLVGIGFNPCTSTLALAPNIQFTTGTIEVTVNLNENNGISLTQGIPISVGDNLAAQIKPFTTFGEITNFSYDGYQSFTAQISSQVPGSGQIMVAFENQILCTNTISSDPAVPSTHTLQTLDYQFIYTPASNTGDSGGVDTGKPRRDAGDISRDSNEDGI